MGEDDGYQWYNYHGTISAAFYSGAAIPSHNRTVLLLASYQAGLVSTGQGAKMKPTFKVGYFVLILSLQYLKLFANDRRMTSKRGN